MSNAKLFGTAPILTLLLALLIGCQKKASDEIDFGTFQESTYTNKYFGVSVAIPPKWSIQDQQSQERLMKAGLKAVAGEDKNLKAMIKASELQTVNLFAAFEHPLGTPVPFNPSMMGMAELVRNFPGVQRGKDYLYQAKKMMENGQMKFSFPKEVYAERIGKAEFDVMDVEMKLPGNTIKQRYYSTIKKGYALCFIISFTTDEEESSVRKILETITFH